MRRPIKGPDQERSLEISAEIIEALTALTRRPGVITSDDEIDFLIALQRAAAAILVQAIPLAKQGDVAESLSLFFIESVTRMSKEKQSHG